MRSLWGEFAWVRGKGLSQKIDAEQNIVEAVSSKTREETFLNPKNRDFKVISHGLHTYCQQKQMTRYLGKDIYSVC